VFICQFIASAQEQHTQNEMVPLIRGENTLEFLSTDFVMVTIFDAITIHGAAQDNK
jgi:hypothetical protein